MCEVKQHDGKELIRVAQGAIVFARDAIDMASEYRQKLDAAYGYVQTLYAHAVKAPRWISVKNALPECDRKPNSFGVPVIVHHKPFANPEVTSLSSAFYGCRVTDEPSFYLYGMELRDVTHWMPYPEAPEQD